MANGNLQVAGSPDPITEMSGQFNTLADTVTSLGDLAGQLQVRLTPVLAAHGPAAVTDKKSVAVVLDSPMANQLAALNERMQQIASSLVDTRDRIRC